MTDRDDPITRDDPSQQLPSCLLTSRVVGRVISRTITMRTDFTFRCFVLRASNNESRNSPYAFNNY